MTYSAPPQVLEGLRGLGSYTGTGASLNVSVGFQPRYIHIFNISAGAIPATRRGGFKSDFMSGNNAIDHTGSTAVGVTFTATGFTVDGVALFNTSTDSYTYYAIR